MSRTVREADPIDPDAEKLEISAVSLLGVRLDAVTERQCIEHVMASLARGQGGAIVTPNLDHLRRCQKDAEFAALVAKANLVVADGMPLIWASRLQGTPLPERVAGSSLVGTLAAAAAEAGRTLFLLGGNPGAAEGAAEVLIARHPALRIVGMHCPPMGFERDDEQMAAIAARLQEARPDIVYVALGSPKQEQLIDRLRSELPGTWWIGVGISLSFLSGEIRRAPRWMQRMGCEWIHRLWQEPGRLFRRYVVEGLPFAVRLMYSACRERCFGGARASDG